MYGKLLVRKMCNNRFSHNIPLPLNIRVTKQGEIIVKNTGLNSTLFSTITDLLPIEYVLFSGIQDELTAWYFDLNRNISNEEQNLMHSNSTNQTAIQSHHSVMVISLYLLCFILFTSIAIVFTTKLVIKSQMSRTQV